MVAGCSTKDSTLPKLSASVKIRNRLRKRFTASKPPSISKVTMPPKPSICADASACCGCEGRPG